MSSAGRSGNRESGVGPGGRVQARALAVALSLALVWGTPTGIRAQSPPWLLPPRSLMPDLLAGTRDPVVKGQLVYSPTDPTLYGPGFSGDVALAATLPVLLLAGEAGGDALVVGLEGAVFARFAFQVLERELVNTDWIVGVSVVWRRGAHWVRLRYYHTSSHLGDEYGQRFDVSPHNFSRDGVDATVYARASRTVAAYGIAFLSVNAHPVRSHGSHVRAGVEVEPGGRSPGKPFLALDVHLETSAADAPRVASQAGVWLPSPSNRPLRLALELVTGPVAMGQIHGVHATQLGLGLYWNP
jgi:hypothetical protein